MQPPTTPSATPSAGARLSLVLPGEAAPAPIVALFVALDRSNCNPRWKHGKGNDSLRATCPVCGGGSTGKRRGSLSATEAGDRLLLTCFRCAPQGCPGSQRAEWLAELIDLLGVAPDDIGLARGIDDATRAEIDAFRAAIGEQLVAGSFRGQRGDTDLRLLTAAWRFAQVARSTTFHASERQWALASGRTRQTCRTGLRRLQRAGWFEIVAEWDLVPDANRPGGITTRGRTWRLANPWKTVKLSPIQPSGCNTEWADS